MYQSTIESELSAIPDNTAIFIYGSGELGQYAYARIQALRQDLQVLGFIDKKAEAGQFKENDLPVISFDTWRSQHATQVFIATNAYYFEVIELFKANQLINKVANYRSDLLDKLYAVCELKTEDFLYSGPDFEAFDEVQLNTDSHAVKPVALYLPQFYPFPENDAWWGEGFTEWRNVVRGRSRFDGHYQPHLPRDLGFYNLRQQDMIRQQVRIAQQSGIHGFCFYYYFFNNKRLLDVPLDLFVNDEHIDFPFCLMWANENWTRRWDGREDDVLIEQRYEQQYDQDMINGLTRYLNHHNYIRVNGRPLFFIYNPKEIPTIAERVTQWRALFNEQDLDPLIYMVQRLMDDDPAKYGLDGAIEFPPHKLCSTLPLINSGLKGKTPDFKGLYYLYDHLVNESLSVEPRDFDLIRTVLPNWDNEPRCPSRGLGFVHSTPDKFQYWLTEIFQYALQHPIQQSDSFVFINAWNEWAEGAHLEPDIYWGSAYLNAIKRALNAL